MDRPAQEPDSRRHDQTSKLLFSHPPAATDLVRDFAAKGWVHGLDLRAVEAFPTESVSADLKRRLGDCAWRVWFKDRRASVVFLVEFQSSVDHEMVFRTMDYSHGAHLAFHRNPGMLDPGGAMPHIVRRRLLRRAAVERGSDVGPTRPQADALVAGGGAWPGGRVAALPRPPGA